MNLFGATVAPIVGFLLFGEIVILAALVIAFLMARMHRGREHHYIMLAAFLADLLVFKPLMLSRASAAWGSYRSTKLTHLSHAGQRRSLPASTTRLAAPLRVLWRPGLHRRLGSPWNSRRPD